MGAPTGLVVKHKDATSGEGLARHPPVGFLRYANCGVIVASCLPLSPRASPFCLLSPHCAKQKAVFLEPEEVRANHRRAARARIHVGQAPISYSESQGHGEKVAGVGLGSSKNKEWKMAFMVKMWTLAGYLWAGVVGCDRKALDMGYGWLTGQFPCFHG